MKTVDTNKRGKKMCVIFCSYQHNSDNQPREKAYNTYVYWTVHHFDI